MKAYIQFSKNNIMYTMLNKYIEFNTKKQLINKIRKSQTKDRELLAYLKNRGYENIEILSRMKF